MQSPGRYLHDNRSVINSAVLRSQHQNLLLEDFVGVEPCSFVIDTTWDIYIVWRASSWAAIRKTEWNEKPFHQVLLFELSTLKAFQCYKARRKQRIFYGQVDRKRLPPPPLLRPVFVNFLCVFDLRLWLYVLWKRFYTRKKSFSSNFLNPRFFLTVHCLWHGHGRIAV